MDISQPLIHKSRMCLFIGISPILFRKLAMVLEFQNPKLLIISFFFCLFSFINRTIIDIDDMFYSSISVDCRQTKKGRGKGARVAPTTSTGEPIKTAKRPAPKPASR